MLRDFTKLNLESEKNVVPFVPEDDDDIGYHPGKDSMGRCQGGVHFGAIGEMLTKSVIDI